MFIHWLWSVFSLHHPCNATYTNVSPQHCAFSTFLNIHRRVTATSYPDLNSSFSYQPLQSNTLSVQDVGGPNYFAYHYRMHTKQNSMVKSLSASGLCKLHRFSPQAYVNLHGSLHRILSYLRIHTCLHLPDPDFKDPSIWSGGQDLLSQALTSGSSLFPPLLSKVLFSLLLFRTDDPSHILLPGTCSEVRG